MRFQRKQWLSQPYTTKVEKVGKMYVPRLEYALQKN